MKRFNFGTFLTDESNRQAYQTCHDMADLKPVTPLPVVLLGDEGCGKTHLLYSIVNRVRAASSKTGLAYVTAHDFPDQVRALIDDPSPVERAQSAILLVDQLERFQNLLEELEGVVRIFLDNHHYVVFATSVHPGRLQHLPEGLRELIEAGQIVQIVPKGSSSQVEMLKRQARADLESQLTSKQEEIDELRALLSRVGKDTNPAGSASLAAIRAELDTERIARTDVTRKLELAETRIQALTKESAEAKAEAERMRIAADEAEAEANRSVQDQFTRIRKQIAEAEQKIMGLNDRLREESATKDSLQETAVTLREQLDLARAEAAENLDTAKDLHAQLNTTRDEAARVAARAEELLARLGEVEQESARRAEELDETKSELAASRESERQLREKLEFATAESASNADAAAQVRQRLQHVEGESAAQASTIDDLLSQLDRSKHEASSAATEAADLRSQLEQARTTIDSNEAIIRELSARAEGAETTEGQLDETRAQLSRAQSELDELRPRFETASSELAAIRSERDDLVQRAGHLLGQVEHNRATAAAAYDEQQARITSLEAELSDARGRLLELEGAEQEIETLRRSLDETTSARDMLRRTLDETTAERSEIQKALASLEEEHSRMRLEFDTVKAARDTAQSSFLRADQALSARTSELDALKREAAAQVAAANAQAGEIEGRMARLQQAYEALRQAGRHAGRQLEATSAAVTQIGRDLATALDGASPVRPSPAIAPVRRSFETPAPPKPSPVESLETKRASDGNGDATPKESAPKESVVHVAASHLASLKALDDLEPFEEEEDHSI